ncbi:hypothetical protein [Psychrobium sp. 1_MG-2023]|nr:hypothetical protein [Psychrobium sp. 1_MG-2023]MDP2560119.1 hypothetical protein [Psychrobium sp. 1_MG-2023]
MKTLKQLQPDPDVIILQNTLWSCGYFRDALPQQPNKQHVELD